MLSMLEHTLRAQHRAGSRDNRDRLIFQEKNAEPSSPRAYRQKAWQHKVAEGGSKEGQCPRRNTEEAEHVGNGM
jgi:hypothetical protein